MKVSAALIVFIFVAGGMGAVARWGLQHILGSQAFPWSTLIVNAVGSGLIGYVFVRQQAAPSLLMTALMVGFLGALTTFSSFSLETLKLLHIGAFWSAGANILGNNLLSLGMCAIGFVVGKIGLE